jgi:dipeptidyl aminopeptidase/acylaminoacyl peptidase
MKWAGVQYGPHHAQVAELWRPAGPQVQRPVVVLLHGGFWRQIFTKRLMHRLAATVVAHGWVAYNVEYRRVGQFGRGGWPETFEDVSAAINSLVDVEGIDHQRVVTCGHSAGGHLALWAGSPRLTGEKAMDGPTIRTCAAISLAGVVDLMVAAQLDLGRGAVRALMGGSPDELPDRYALASPASLLPMGIRQILIHGLADATVPASLSAAYVDAALAQGDDAEYVPVVSAGHMDMIDPHGAAIGELLTRLDQIASTPSD